MESLVVSRGSAPFVGDLVQLSPGPLPRNKGLRYPPDPPTVEEIIAVVRSAADGLEEDDLCDPAPTS